MPIVVEDFAGHRARSISKYAEDARDCLVRLGGAAHEDLIVSMASTTKSTGRAVQADHYKERLTEALAAYEGRLFERAFGAGSRRWVLSNRGAEGATRARKDAR